MRSDLLSAIAGVVNGPAYKQGLSYKKADLHLHSSYSYDVLNLPELSPRALYEKAVADGMGFFTLTDHETMLGIRALERELAAEYGDKPPIPVISGIEIKVRDPKIGHTVHVNVLGLDQRQMLALARRRKSLDRFLEFCQNEDLYHAYNHPFWFERGERGELSTIKALIERFPIVEMNAGRIPQLNGRTLQLARMLGKQVVATSDSHTGQVGKAYTMAPGDTAEEFLRNVRSGVSQAVPHNVTVRGFIREVGETIDLVFVRQTAFRPKPTFLRQLPVARWIAHTTLGSERIMKPRSSKRLARAAMQILAYAPALAFILQQLRMHARLGEIEF
jgi:predicted metal-dependent phosphoesterase TrpH